MANWKYKFNLKDFYHDDNISIQNKAKMVAERIGKTFSDFVSIESTNFDSELDEIKDDFEWLATDSSAKADDFDDVMERLYDWADAEIEPFGKWPRNKMCWVETR